jgi:hypothetical protein
MSEPRAVATGSKHSTPSQLVVDLDPVTTARGSDMNAASLVRGYVAKLTSTLEAQLDLTLNEE